MRFLLAVCVITLLICYNKLQSSMDTEARRLYGKPCPDSEINLVTNEALKFQRQKASYADRSPIRNEALTFNIQRGPEAGRNAVRNGAPPSYSRVAPHLNSIAIPGANHNINSLPLWQKSLQQCQAVACRGDNSSSDQTKQYFLTVVVRCRIYETDKAKWTVRELKQWLHYLFLAGVEHIYLCDDFHYDSERMDIALQRYTQAGIVTYIPWANKSSDTLKVQMMCYQHVIDHYGNLSTWQMAIDMDEYPFSVIDTREGFVPRFLENITQSKGSGVTEISMQNYLMLGQGNRSRDLVIDRIDRMTPRQANNLVKPVYRPERVVARMHHNRILSGDLMVADSNMLRMAHYWGARTQNWGPDTPETIKKTVEMNLVRKFWVEKLRNSLLSWEETDAFATASGP